MKKSNYTSKRNNIGFFYSSLQLLFCFILFCLLNSTLLAQTWLHQYPEIGGGADIVEAPNGDLLTIAEQIGNPNQAVVTRVDQEGNVIWLKNFATASITYSQCLTILNTPDGHYVAGYLDSIPTNGELIVGVSLEKFDDAGNTIWKTQHLAPSGGIRTFRSLVVSNDGGFIVSQITDELNSNILKLNTNGELEWIQPFPNIRITRTIQTENGDLISCGNHSFNETHDIELFRTNSMGELIWTKTFGSTTHYDFSPSVIETQDNGIAFLSFSTSVMGNEIALIKTNMQGDSLWSVQFEAQYATAEGTSKLLFQEPDGTFLITNLRGFGYTRPAVLHVDENGNLLTTENTYTSGPIYHMSNFAPCMNGGYAVVGHEWVSGIGSKLVIAKTNNLGLVLHGIVNGNVFKDGNTSCNWDASEIGLSNWIVTARNINDQNVYSATTDQSGDYELILFDGTYEISASPPVPLWQICPILSNQTVTINSEEGEEGIQTVDFPMQVLYECPIMDVAISSPLLRRCFDNTYFVNYCNMGTDLATDVYIEVVLDDFMDVISASIPFENQMDTLLIFQVGDINIGECGQFLITANIDCESTILGQTHCTTAHIYPDDYCLPEDVDWDMSNITLNGVCETDSVRFIIQNEGTGDMGTILEYLIVVDEVIMLQGDFQLNSGEIQEVAVEATGQTYRMEAGQSPGHPENTEVSFTLDGCPDMGNLGFVNWFSQNDFNTFIDIDCQENVGAYDPNDKKAFPRGYGDAHQIEPNTPIEYLIRFQNTGTDTAFQVVVRDELSEHLDPRTFSMDVASHPYQWEIFDNNLLKVVFDDIMLPDSNINEAASHGFFKFSIQPKETVELGTVVENTADIYFDFNEPIITNTVFQTIDTGFVVIDLINFNEDINSQASINVFPNPLKTQAQIVIDHQEFKQLNLEIYDSAGRLVRQLSGSGNSLTIPANGLQKGIYFFKLFGEADLIGTGKLVLVD